MDRYNQEIEKIKNQLVRKYQPVDIILFGSCAKGRVSRNSDIDLCLIFDTTDKRKMIMDILSEIEYDVDLDVVIYTQEEWRKYKNNKATFAGAINKTGVSLFG